MFGRRARLPVDINAEANYDPDQNWGSLPIKMSRMKSRMMPSKERWKDWWNQILKQSKQNRRSIMMRSLVHHHAPVLAAQYWKRISQGGKLDYRWQGPYIITAALVKGLFQLKELNGDRVDSSCASYWNHNIYGIFVVQQVVERVNGFHLKKYICPESSNESPPP